MRQVRNWERQAWTLQSLGADDPYYTVTRYETEEWPTGHVHVKRTRRMRFDDGRLSRTQECESFRVGKLGGVKRIHHYSVYDY